MSHGTKVPSNSVLSTTNESTKKLSQCQHRSPVVPARKDDNVTFLLNNCTFSSCSVTFPGHGVQSTERSVQEKEIVTDRGGSRTSEGGSKL